jgi:hypothetical protein
MINISKIHASTTQTRKKDKKCNKPAKYFSNNNQDSKNIKAGLYKNSFLNTLL